MKPILYIVLIALLFGCSTGMQPKVLHLKDITVLVYERHPDFNRFGPGFGGVIGTGGDSTITVEGYLYKGKVVLSSPGALGHELIHLLNQTYPGTIWNPDAIGD
jgi:hypothetical protein